MPELLPCRESAPIGGKSGVFVIADGSSARLTCLHVAEITQGRGNDPRIAGRADAARRRLEESPDSLERIAALCGFGSAERMRRAFQRQLGVSPNSYRERFAATERCDLTRERSKHDG